MKDVVKRRIKKLIMKEPTLENVTSQLCTASQFKEDIYAFWLKEIVQELKLHRKQWEYVYTLQAFKKYDLLRSGVKGLGFGCGKEPLPAVMAKYGCDILATDIEPVEEGDEYWGARSATDIFYPGICSEETFHDRVSFRNMDMTRISEDLLDGGFDFVWSCCALEHLGSLQTGMDFVLNSARCLRRGGVAVHTTEINLLNGDETLETPGLSLYRKKDIKELKSQLEKNGFSLLTCNWSKGTLPEDDHVDQEPYKFDIHIKLQIEQCVVTSLGLIVVRN
jgi:2-polyprenyl-3-methyl-5-hydroxy-6-metoxy-1,4-benzoquinol methylase